MKKQITVKIKDKNSENLKEKYSDETKNVLYTIESEDNKPYTKTTFLRVMGVGQFVQAIGAEGRKIVGLTFEDNLLGFILDDE